MLRIPGGSFLMGSDHHYPEERPARRVAVSPFLMDATTVTNRQFGAFVAATGYVTVAERPPDPALYPGAKPENLQPGSLVFTGSEGRVDLSDYRNWWTWTPGACWRHPEGPGSNLAGREDHPVVQVAYENAAAYAAWAGKALPTEAEWEFAARGALEGAEFVWGDELTPGGRQGKLDPYQVDDSQPDTGLRPVRQCPRLRAGEGFSGLDRKAAQPMVVPSASRLTNPGRKRPAGPTRAALSNGP
ncbi:SUMF1/EgtB/PvdO family nonheme iron enzyme [Falsiroseomonas sp. HW251]|uniref:SUMF1/EgtB/PvdO family nonheme iron enzyme n=1 Tax=Falsiroseomonas sp. HW251 TaxID=3390998 RepID=UPI003D31424E